jgi:pimeloyl-ACP methyl ester carboxylesterase
VRRREGLGGVGIDTIERLSIGGVAQWISLRSDDVRNPIILFLHGGPGTAQIAWSRKAQRSLESSFVVVNWDQRGAGRSYARSLRKEDMTIERFVDDAEELVETLLERFEKQRLIVVGQSWGSIIGMSLAARRPELLVAYVGVGQVVDMARGETLSYEFTLREATRRCDQRAIRQLERIGSPPYAKLRSGGVQRRWLSRFHGTTYEGSLARTVVRNVSVGDTRPLDLIRFVAGAMFSLSSLEDQQMGVDLVRDLPELHVPVYFCVGRRDYTTPFALTVEYAEKLQAPTTQIVWFERSGHLPNLEEPELFCEFCKTLTKT